MRKRRSSLHVAAADRHAGLLSALRRAVLESDGVTDRSLRLAAADDRGDLPPGMAAYLQTVRAESYRITDADVAALRTSGHDEEEIFELTIAAALGAALRSLHNGLRVVEGPG